MAEREHLLSRRGGVDYEQDYGAWIAEQARLLRERRLDALDVDNLIDEVESLGRSDFKAFVSAIEVVLMHMLKWDHQPAKRTRSWALSIAEHRERAEAELEDSPSYRARADEAVARAYKPARINASRETELPLRTFAEQCPYDWATIMTRDHDLADER